MPRKIHFRNVLQQQKWNLTVLVETTQIDAEFRKVINNSSVIKSLLTPVQFSVKPRSKQEQKQKSSKSEEKIELSVRKKFFSP